MEIKTMLELFHSTDFGADKTTLHIFESGHAKLSNPWNWETTNPSFSRLYYMADGEASIIVNGNLTTLEKGYVYLLPVGVPLKNISKKYMEQLFFHINIYDFTGFDILSNCKVCPGIPVNYIPELIKLYQSNYLLDILELKQVIISDCIKFLRKSECELSARQYSENVRRAIKYIKQNLSANLSVKNICNALLIPKTTLNSHFNRELGKSVGEYINDIVLEKSKRLLLKDSSSLSEISDELGFCDQFYFSRKFKEKYGETPSSYRKNNFIK